MKRILFILTFLAALPLADAMTSVDDAYLKGIQDGYALGTSYMAGKNDSGYKEMFDGLVDNLNTWMDRVGYTGQRWAHHALPGQAYELAPIFRDLSRPYIEVNQSKTGSIVHEIDGQNKMRGPTYTTNDANLLPDEARYNTTTKTYSDLGGQWLGGI